MGLEQTHEARALRLIRIAGDMIDNHLCKIVDGRKHYTYPDTLYECVHALLMLADDHLYNLSKKNI